jgi:O-antigen/teichoic acid export membrane protein
VASEAATRPAPRAELRSLVRGGSLNLAGFVASGVLGFALAIVVTRGLGAAGAGVFFSAVATFTIVSNVAELGADTGIVRFVARLRELGTSEDVRRTVFIALVPVALVSTVAAVVVFAEAPALARVFARDHTLEVGRVLRLIAPFLPFATISTVALAGTRGYGTMAPFALTEGVAKPAVRPLAVLALMAGGLSAIDVALAWSIPEGLGCAVALVVLFRLIGRDERAARAIAPSGTTGLARDFWAFSAPRSFAAAFQVTVIYIDLLLLGHFRSTAEVGVYAATSRLVTVGTFALQAVRLAIAPHISALLAREDHRGAEDLYQTATWWLMAISWPIFLMLAVFAPVVLGIFGRGFSSGQGALVILSLAMLVNLGTGNVSMVLLMSGRSGWNLLNEGVALVLNIVLNLLLIPRLGMAGAAISWAVSIAADNLMAAAEVRILLGMGPFGPGYGVVAASSVACFAGLGLAARWLWGATWFALVVGGALATAAFAALLFRNRDVMRLGLVKEAIGSRSHPGGEAAAGAPSGAASAAPRPARPGSSVPAPLRAAARSAIRKYGIATAGSRPLPEFLVIGTKRGGTTSLAAYLHDHPDVAPMFPRRAVPKGVRFFDDHFEKGPRWYRSHFASRRARRGSPPKIAGEATAHYLFDPRAAARAAELVPEARILVLLRDPVERAFSHHRERTRQGVETLSFEDALRAEDERLDGELERMMADPGYVSFNREHFSYRSQGRYVEYLPAWIERFGRERLMVIVSEDFYEDPAREYHRALAFLQLRPHDPVYEAHNSQPVTRGMDPHTREKLDAFFASHTRELERFLGMELPWGPRRRDRSSR